MILPIGQDSLGIYDLSLANPGMKSIVSDWLSEAIKRSILWATYTDWTLVIPRRLLFRDKRCFNTQFKLIFFFILIPTRRRSVPLYRGRPLHWGRLIFERDNSSFASLWIWRSSLLCRRRVFCLLGRDGRLSNANNLFGWFLGRDNHLLCGRFPMSCGILPSKEIYCDSWMEDTKGIEWRRLDRTLRLKQATERHSVSTHSSLPPFHRVPPPPAEDDANWNISGISHSTIETNQTVIDMMMSSFLLYPTSDKSVVLSCCWGGWLLLLLLVFVFAPVLLFASFFARGS